MIVSNRVRLDVMPNGNLAIEVGDCEAVVILTPVHARQLATRIRTALGGEDLVDLPGFQCRGAPRPAARRYGLRRRNP